MSLKLGAIVVTVAIGLLVAGPLAAVVLVAVPADWQGPAIPVAAGVVALVAVALWRHAGGGAGEGPHGSSTDGRDER